MRTSHLKTLVILKLILVRKISRALRIRLMHKRIVYRVGDKTMSMRLLLARHRRSDSGVAIRLDKTLSGSIQGLRSIRIEKEILSTPGLERLLPDPDQRLVSINVFTRRRQTIFRLQRGISKIRWPPSGVN